MLCSLLTPHETPSRCHRTGQNLPGPKRGDRFRANPHRRAHDPSEHQWNKHTRLPRRKFGFHCLMTLLFPANALHMRSKKEGRPPSFSHWLTCCCSFPLRSSALSHFRSDFLRQLNYTALGPFVFEQNISEWSFWVIRNIFQLDPISHLVSWRLLAKRSFLSEI